MTKSRFLICLFFSLSVLGCAPQTHGFKYRFVWPNNADAAKVEYISFYASESGFKQPIFATLSEVVLGVEPAKPVFAYPFSVDARLNKIVITDIGTRSVFLVDRKTGSVESFYYLNEEKKPSFPTGVAIISDREFLLVDTMSAQVDRYDFDGDRLGSFGKEVLARPTAIAFNPRSRRIVVTDPSAHRLAVFSDDARFLGYLGERGDGAGQFNFPLDADFDENGDLYVLDSMNFRVQRFALHDNKYQYVSEFGELGSAEGSFSRPKGLAVSPAGHVYVVDALGHKVLVFSREGDFLLAFGRKFIASDGKFAPGGLYLPSGISVDENNGIWVVDSLNRMVHQFQYLDENYLREHPLSPEQIAPIMEISP